jgi:hypothetical protein
MKQKPELPSLLTKIYGIDCNNILQRQFGGGGG